MEYRHLGRSGLRISALSFGSWVTFGPQLDDNLAHECMKAARDAGVNFFDNAEVYAGGQSEVIMGRVLKKSGWKRSDLIISTKIFWGGRGPNDRGLSRKHLLEGVDAALARMQLDYVDLVFAHRPDLHTPIEETVRAMSYLVNSGRAFYWGTSEWSAERIMEAWHIARREHLVPPTMEQPEYNLFKREKVESEFAELYEEIGLGTTTWSPLASGILTGKYANGIPESSRVTLPGYEWLRESFESEKGQARIAKTEKLRPVADELGCTPAQLAIAWCVSNPDVSTVITGASKPEQVEENMRALDIAEKLTPELLERIDGILGNRPAPPKDWRG